jgi:hypothetical protein
MNVDVKNWVTCSLAIAQPLVTRRQPEMEQISGRAKGVAAAAKNAVVATHDHLAADTAVHSPAAPLRFRKNMAEVVVDDAFHEFVRNDLLQFPPPVGSQRAEMMRLCAVGERSFELLWINGHSDAKLTNLHKREKPVTLHVSGVGVTVERTETKKLEARLGPFDWWQILHWEVGKTSFSFCVRHSQPSSEQVFQFTTRSAMGASLKTPAASVGHSFEAIMKAFAESLRPKNGGGDEQLSLSALVTTEDAAQAAARPVFQAARSPVQPRVVKPLFAGGGLAPPPKSGLSKRTSSNSGSSGSSGSSSRTTALSPGSTQPPATPAAQSPVRPFAQPPSRSAPWVQHGVPIRELAPEPEPEPQPQPAIQQPTWQAADSGVDPLDCFFASTAPGAKIHGGGVADRPAVGGDSERPSSERSLPVVVPSSVRIVPGWSGSGVEQLIAMGFDQKSCDAALDATGGDVAQAAEWLLQGNRAPPDTNPFH